jgi:thioredoxin reductase
MGEPEHYDVVIIGSGPIRPSATSLAFRSCTTT